MKPLVYYCRWQGAALRLRGRNPESVWGHLVFTDEAGEERLQEFSFALKTAVLTLKRPEGDQQLALDEMGVVKDEA